jgi:hypothetical protein
LMEVENNRNMIHTLLASTNENLWNKKLEYSAEHSTRFILVIL